MQIKFDANKKRLDTTPAFGLLVQGENLAESIQITGPKMVGALDLSQLRVAVRMTSQQYETTVEKTLEQTTDGDTITFTWQVDKQFTSSPGKVDVMLVGYGGNEEVIKITSSGMVVQEDKTFGAAPPESTWEQILQQMQDFATQAYESKTAAENSAAAAAESQRVTEEKAAQATEAASTAAAQAAAKTEQQIRQYADDRYARPLVTKTGPAASLEVYPDKLSNLKVYANGFATQAGTGDPSPTNVRALTNGGLRYTRVVLDGTETVNAMPRKSSLSGNFYEIRASKINTPVTDFNPPANTTVCNKLETKNPYSNIGDFCTCGTLTGVTSVRIGFSPENDPGGAQGVKALLKTAYDSRDPYIVWVPQTTEGSLYAPIILEGGEYRATCLPLTAPLCEGDSVVSWMKSGCDKVITLTGANVRDVSGNKVYFGTDSGATIDNLPALGTGFAICDNTFQFISTTYWAGLTAGKFTYGNGQIGVYDVVNTTKELAQEYYNAHPLTVRYRSTNYTEAADIPVSLETHVQAVLVLDGSVDEAFETGNNGTFVFRSVKPNVPNFESTAVANVFKPYAAQTLVDNGLPGMAASSANGIVFRWGDEVSTVEQLRQALQSTNAVVCYPLTTPLVYAHPAVVLPALPDNTGKVTITGQSGGTVTAVFNKSIIKEIAEIKAAMLAMGANLSV